MTTNIFSQVQFTPHMIRLVPDPRSVFAIDLDGDGDMDVLSASGGGGLPGGNEIAWYENDGNENFTFRMIATSANGGESVFAIDLDSDGDIDVLSASVFDNKIAWYENDGNENFTTHDITQYPDLAWGARTVFAIDLDGDGDIDVLSASTDDDRVAWYENDGNENFTPHTITTSADNAWSVYAIDVDGDGDIDVLSASNYDNKIAWYENDGNENFTPHTITTSADWANSVYAIDVDSDGDMDVLSASFLDGKVAWYENDGDENFTPHTIKEDFTIVTFWIFAADIDNDGDIDVISSEDAWYENDGNENFTTHAFADGSRSVYAVDMDGDADIDIISDKITWYENLSAPISIEFDIKPQSCPNPIFVNSKGVLPVAILGTDEFDVTTIDPASLLLQGVAPLRWSIEDVSAPAPDGCTTEGADGFDDLTLKFDMQEIVTALGDVVDGDEMVLSLTGELIEGRHIEGADKIIIISKTKKSASILDDVDEINGIEVNIYPNPFDELTYVDLISNVSRQIIIDMVDMNGRIVEHVFSGSITANVEHQFELNTKPDLIPGSYMLLIRTSSGELLGREIILK